MKGLLMKDFQLMKNQGKILIAIFVVNAAFGIFADGNSSFLTAYFTIFLALFTTSTISYDEYDSSSSDFPSSGICHTFAANLANFFRPSL